MSKIDDDLIYRMFYVMISGKYQSKIEFLLGGIEYHLMKSISEKIRPKHKRIFILSGNYMDNRKDNSITRRNSGMFFYLSSMNFYRDSKGEPLSSEIAIEISRKL